MIIYTSYIWVLTALFGFVSCYVGSQINLSCENGVCSRQADQGPCVVSDDHERLFRWDPVKVNRSDLTEWQCKKCRFYLNSERVWYSGSFVFKSIHLAF